MNKLTIPATAEFLRRRDHFTIVTHARPDGDTLGASAALCRILRALGKTAHVLENPRTTPTYAWLHQGLTKACPAPGDTVVCVDVAAAHLLPEGFVPCPIDLRIDHHSGPDSFTANELVDSSRGACTEIIYELSLALGVALDQDMADAIYTGTVTDTDCFRFANTTGHTLAVAAACVDAGARNFEINRLVFEENLLQRLRLQSYIAENHRLLAGGRGAIVAIPYAVQQQIGANVDDLNYVLNFLQSLTKAHLTATLLETSAGGTRLSVRSVPGVDCAAVAAAFGGGGHLVAAGANMALPLDQADTALEKEMLSHLTEGEN